MGWYRRPKLVFDAFRRGFTSRVFTGVPVQGSSSRSVIQQRIGSSIPASTTNRSSGLASSSLISHRLLFYSNANRLIQCNSFNQCWKRYYSKPRGWPRRWFLTPRNVFIAVTVGSGVFITVYLGNLETIPYSKRTHFVILSKAKERQIGETQFEKEKDSFKGRVLPANHPESVRVRLIAKNILDALHKELKHDQQVLSDLDYASPDASLGHDASHYPDDQLIQQMSRKEKGKQPSTTHLEGLNWEVLVVDKPTVNAFCLPGGKIVVYTGLLELCRSDAEIATVIGHEVGHVIARHAAENVTKFFWFAILLLIVLFVMPDAVRNVTKMSDLLLRLPFSRKMEMEADYIGLLLMASGGYDPRVAPRVYEEIIGKDREEESELRRYFSTHPSGKKRAQQLAQPQVMEQALILHTNSSIRPRRAGINGGLIRWF